MLDKLTAQHKVVLLSDDVNKNVIGQDCRYFVQSINQSSLIKLFSSYSFDSVIYFAGRPDEASDASFDMPHLEQMLLACSNHDVERFIFVSSTYVYNGLLSVTEETTPSPADNISLQLYACEQLCEIYKKNNGLSVMILRIPCMFGLYESASLIGNMVQQIAMRGFAQIGGLEQQVVDFLSQEDFGELLMRLHQQWPEHIEIINVPGARQISLLDLSVSLKKVAHATRISFSEQPATIFAPISSVIAKQEFDWVPIVGIEDEISSLVTNINAKTISTYEQIRQQIIDFIFTKSTVVMVVELAAGYALMEALNRITSTSVQFSYVDFRLLYVVLLGTIHGIGAGFIAAILACVSLTVGYMNSGIDWRVIVFGIDNWLPYASYFFAGAITGYTKDKHTNDYMYISEEKDDLEKRYRFLNDIYNSSLQNKQLYKKQIISYRNSFGRMLDITLRLNTMLPDAIFKEALLSLEDILENQTISIYSVEKGSIFGRLRVCSKKIMEITPKSLDLKDYRVLIDSFKKNQVWSNTDRIQSYPDYFFPIFNEDALALLVMVNRVSHDQMAMYFENMLRIICTLIESALLRAQQYHERFADEFYLPDSRIMKKDAFKDVLRVRAQMEEVAISEYSLISVDATPDTMRDIALQLQKFLRESDVIGEGENGRIYVILSQAKEENIPFVLDRLKSAGMLFNQITDEAKNLDTLL